METRNAEKLSITLPAEMARRIRETVRSGAYGSNSELIREALRGWLDRDRRLATLDTAIARGVADAEAGRAQPVDEVPKAPLTKEIRGSAVSESAQASVVGSAAPVNRDELMSLLRQQLPELTRRFDLKKLAVFGSAARNELRADSDIDVLVEFHSPATLERYMGVKFFLKELLARPVDLVTEKGLRPEFRPTVEGELLVVA